MRSTPDIQEQYTKGNDVINYVVYKRSDGSIDEVLQHKIGGTTESGHVTLHPVGEPHLRETRAGLGKYIDEAIKNHLQGYSPMPSANVRKFISKVRGKY